MINPAWCGVKNMVEELYAMFTTNHGDKVSEKWEWNERNLNEQWHGLNITWPGTTIPYTLAMVSTTWDIKHIRADAEIQPRLLLFVC